MAEKVIIDLEAKVDKAIDGVEKLNDSVKDLRKDGAKATENLQKGVEDVGKSAKGTEKGVSKLAKGFKGVGVAMKAAGIGLVIAALTKLKEVFESNQVVADTFSIAFETISLVFNEFANVIIDVYEGVAKSSENFDALGKVISGLLTISITPLKLAFFAIKGAVLSAQLAWEQSFLGGKDPETILRLTKDLKKADDEIKQVALDAVQAGVDVATNLIEAGKELGKITSDVIEGVSEISIAGALESAKTNVQLKKSAEIASAANQGLIEKYDRQAEQLRQIRDDDTIGISERIEANNQLKAVLDEQEKAMLKNAQAILAAAEAEHSKNNNQENTIALLEAQNELAGVSAQIEGFRSEQISNRIALEKEGLELTNSKLEAENALSFEQKRFNAGQIEDEVLKLERLREIIEQEKEVELERLQNKIEGFKLGTQARLDAEIEYSTKKQEIDQELSDNTLASKEALAAAEIAVSNRKRDAEKKNMELVGKTIGNLSAIAGENTKTGKALAVAGATMNTYQGVTDALAAKTVTPFETALKFVNAAAIGVAGIMNVKKILAVKVPSVKGASGGASGGGTPSVPAVQAPSFNVVGSSGSNQLAEAIGGQEQQPVQAFVVSNDVTTAQSMERNIVEGASLG